MNIQTIFLIIIIVALIAGAVFYIKKAAKAGVKCVGCPYAKNCGSKTCSCESKE